MLIRELEIQEYTSDLDPSRRVILVILNNMVDMNYKFARNLSKSIDIFSRESMSEIQNKTFNDRETVQEIFVPLTFLACIYGMNFTNIPELKDPKGYFIDMGAMFLIAGIELLIFVRKGWLK